MAVSNIDAEIGARLRQRRQDLGLSLTRVGQMLNPPVQQQQVSKFERGENRLAAPQIVALCAGLQISPSELLGVEPSPPSEDDVEAVRLGRIIAGLPAPARAAVAHLVRVMGDPTSAAA